MIGLIRKDGAALHHQLFSILRTGIVSGRYAAGDLLPSEEWLAENYNVSRATVRRAMQTLEARGMIERWPGVGTRVLTASQDTPPVSVGLSFGAQDVGDLTMLAFEFVRAPADVATQLGLSAGESVLKIVRLRALDALPVRVTTHYLPAYLGERLSPDSLRQKLIVDALAEFGALGESARVTIGAVIADAVDADVLKVEIGSPLVELTRVVQSSTGELVLLQHTLLPPERQKLIIEVARDEETKLPVLGMGPRVRVSREDAASAD